MVKLRGTFKGGVVVPDEGKALPDGTRVTLEPVDEPALGPEVLGLAGSIEGYLADFAKNHDHYIHGARKRK